MTEVSRNPAAPAVGGFGVPGAAHAPESGDGTCGAARAPLAPPPVIKIRADFVRAARARYRKTPSFVLQARQRGDDGPARMGYTCSKKVGNAVARNRAKRRLREAARHVLPKLGRPGWDYVLIGRRDVTAARPWPELLEDLRAALRKIHT